ncbi:MFS transporter [Streptomyces sp. NPDC059445]|uniref:MFS transporter n=1 Tax=Streptomyces sp. NPDC059445 TaxID=3346832 RepID=UPI0036C24FB6
MQATRAKSQTQGRIVCLGAFITSVSFFIDLPLIPLYYRELGHGTGGGIGAGLTVSVTFIISAIVSPIWGRASDRFGPRSMIARASLSMTIVYVLMALCVSPAQLFIMRVLNGFGSGFQPAAGQYLLGLVPEERRGRAFSEISIARSSGAIIGPALGGFLAAGVGYRAAFLTAGALTAVSGIITLTAGKVERPTEQKAGSKSSGRGTWNLPKAAVALLGIFAFVTAAATMLQFSLPVTLAGMTSEKTALNVGGLVFTITGVVGISAAYPWGMAIDRFGYWKTLIVTQIGVLPLLLAGSLAANAWQLSTVFIVYTIVSAEIGTMLQLAIVDKCGEGRSGQALGFTNTASRLGLAAGPLAAGWAGEVGGSTAVFLAVFVAHLIILGYVLLSSRGTRPGEAEVHAGDDQRSEVA